MSPAVVGVIRHLYFYKLTCDGVVNGKYCIVHHPLLLLVIVIHRIPTFVGLLCSARIIPFVDVPLCFLL